MNSQNHSLKVNSTLFYVSMWFLYLYGLVSLGIHRSIDMEHLAQHTVKYVAFVMGKPAEFYTGKDMYTAHAKYHINGMHFDEVADVLKDVLTAAGMAKPDIALVMLRVESLREMIIA